MTFEASWCCFTNFASKSNFREHCECQIHVLTASQFWLSGFVTENIKSGYLQKSSYRYVLIVAICMSLNFQSEGFRFRTRKYPELSTVDKFASCSPVWRWSSTAATAWLYIHSWSTVLRLQLYLRFYSSAYALQLCLRFYSSAYADLSRSLGRDSETMAESDHSASHLRNVSQEILNQAIGLPTW